MPIRVLDAATVGRIAAGEVVERPASVIKELLENALDAGATSITVEIREGGATYLRVTDNGSGIPANEARLAFENHATSKLRSGDPLDNILTLGFRGEALPSIAAVARVEVNTRTHNAPSGLFLRVEGGKFLESHESGCPEGTTIIVRDLFYNTPARRAFLKKPAYEASTSIDMVQKMIMGNPRASIRLINNGRLICHSFGDGSLRHAALSVYGREVAENVLEMNQSEGALTIRGLIGVGDCARPNRAQQSFFINGRLVRCPLICHALEQACQGRVTIGNYPMCALHITLPVQAVDINVHPNKLEVRFRDEAAMRLNASAMFERALTSERMLDIDSLTQKAEGAAVEKHIEHDRSMEKPMPEPTPEQTIFLKKQTEDIQKQTVFHTSGFSEAPRHSDPVIPFSHTRANAPAVFREESGPAFANYTEDAREGASVDQDAQAAAQTDVSIAGGLDEAAPAAERAIMSQAQAACSGVADAAKQIQAEKEPKRSAISPTGDSGAENGHAQDEEPGLRVIGVLFNTYILAEAADTLLLIDQHAAHERLLYEKYKKMLDSGQASQQLLTPVIVSVTRREQVLLAENEALLREAGYEIEPFGERDIQVRAVPFVLGKADLQPLFLSMIDRLDQLKSAAIDRRRGEIIKFSCKRAVKGGDTLSQAEIQALLRDMQATGAPPTCPHGRPVMRAISRNELERMFKRQQ